MVSKGIIDFIFRHPGVEVTFREKPNNKKCILMIIRDEINNLYFEKIVHEQFIIETFIEHVLSEAEKEMYGEKEEHNE